MTDAELAAWAHDLAPVVLASMAAAVSHVGRHAQLNKLPTQMAFGQTHRTEREAEAIHAAIVRLLGVTTQGVPGFTAKVIRTGGHVLVVVG